MHIEKSSACPSPVKMHKKYHPTYWEYTIFLLQSIIIIWLSIKMLTCQIAERLEIIDFIVWSRLEGSGVLEKN